MASRGLDRIVGRSQVIQDACEKTLRAARSNSTVLLLGESGTGKELFAEAIHRHSSRSQGPFVVVNMAAIPDTLVESELFGHVRGAFTGADNARIGRFEAAHGGTLFIDEIGDFPLQLQAKLLRALETRSVTPVGSGTEKSVDVRVVAATSRPLARMKDEGLFARICTIGSTSLPSRCRHCGSAGRTSRCWCSIFWRNRPTACASPIGSHARTDAHARIVRVAGQCPPVAQLPGLDARDGPRI